MNEYTTVMSTSTPIIQLQHISHQFSGQTVLDDVSLVAYPGEVIALLGPSGAGKSTLLRCMNLLTVPDAGSLFFQGQLVALMTRRGQRCATSMHQVRNLRTHCGFVFQQFNLWTHLTILQNLIAAPMHVLKHSKSEASEQAMTLLKQIGLADKAHCYPQQLSGGQQQRVAIARALAMQPLLLLFDEPTSALDRESSHELLLMMRSLVDAQKTMIIATHELAFAKEIANQIIFIDHGRIIHRCATHELANNIPERLARFLQTHY